MEAYSSHGSEVCQFARTGEGGGTQKKAGETENELRMAPPPSFA